MFPRSVKRFTFYQFSVQPAEPLNVLLMVRSPDSLSSQLVTRGGCGVGGGGERGEGWGCRLGDPHPNP